MSLLQLPSLSGAFGRWQWLAFEGREERNCSDLFEAFAGHWSATARPSGFKKSINRFNIFVVYTLQGLCIGLL